MCVDSPVDLVKSYVLSLLTKSVSWTWFSGGFSSVEPAAPCPFCVTSMRASCVHTAVIRRKEMQHDKRSMNGTRLIAASSGFLPPLPLGVGAAPPIGRLL